MAAQVEVTSSGGHAYEVTVRAGTTTRHRVRVSPDYHRKLARRGESVESLIERSFDFLLAREPNTSILSEFDLSLINRYFPEYESTIR